MKNKKSLSEVISTVLLVLVAVVAVVIIIGFVVPFVNEQLSKGDCIKVAGEIRLVNSPQYTCYNSSNHVMLVQVHLGDILDKIKGFSIILGGASSKAIEITNNTHVTGVTMYGAAGNLLIPGKNEEITYRIESVDVKPDSVGLSPILNNGHSCDISDISPTVVNCFVG